MKSLGSVTYGLVLGGAILSWSALAAAQVPATCDPGPTTNLLWHVPRVEHHEVSGQFYGDNYCETTILVTNLSKNVALVQVDFQAGGTNRCIQDQLAAGASLAFATAPMTPLQNAFFPGSPWSDPGTAIGLANVHSDRKDVEVAVYLVCRDAPISSPGHVQAMMPLQAIRVR